MIKIFISLALIMAPYTKTVKVQPNLPRQTFTFDIPECDLTIEGLYGASTVGVTYCQNSLEWFELRTLGPGSELIIENIELKSIVVALTYDTPTAAVKITADPE